MTASITEVTRMRPVALRAEHIGTKRAMTSKLKYPIFIERIGIYDSLLILKVLHS
jgi:hypothetical protein